TATATEVAIAAMVRRPITSLRGLLADELQVVDEYVVLGGRNVDLELDAVDLRLRDVRLARVAPARHLLHRLPREDVQLPVLGEVQGTAEFVEALGADRAVRIGVGVRHLEADLSGRVRALLRPERDAGVLRRVVGSLRVDEVHAHAAEQRRARADLAVEARRELRTVA